VFANQSKIHNFRQWRSQGGGGWSEGKKAKSVEKLGGGGGDTRYILEARSRLRTTTIY
jgi:hypothetical protein